MKPKNCILVGIGFILGLTMSRIFNYLTCNKKSDSYCKKHKIENDKLYILDHKQIKEAYIAGSKGK